jgi:hypothetical protein
MRRAGTLGPILFLLGACGYRPLYGHHDRVAAPLHVVLHASSVPNAAVSDDVVVGIREELARGGDLAAGDGYPRCEVEVLRADESSDAVAAGPEASGVRAPVARATRVAIVARAWVVRERGASPERDTGDVRVDEAMTVTNDATAASFQYTDGLRVAARRAGKRVGARLLGLPTPTSD